MKDLERLGLEGFPRVYFSTKDEYNYYMVMDRLPHSLSSFLDKKTKTLSLKTTTQVGLAMIKRLEQLHKNGYVHRDIKASNIMVGPSSTGDMNYLYIIDFSVTKKWTPGLNDTELLKWKIA